MEFDYYRLPSGEVIPVDATASKGAPVIGFTQADGHIVDVTLVSRGVPPYSIRKQLREKTLAVGRKPAKEKRA